MFRQNAAGVGAQPGPPVSIGASLPTLIALGAVALTAFALRRRSRRAASEAERADLLARERQARQAAEAATAQLRAVLDVLPIGVVIADGDQRLIQANDAAQDVWGDLPLVERVEDYRVFKGWWPGTDRIVAPEEWALARALQTGEMCAGEEVEIETFDGERKTILNHAVPIRDDGGAITGGVAVMLDITARKRLERHTHEALDALLQMASVLVDVEVDGGEAETAASETTGAVHRLLTLACSVLGCERVSITVSDSQTGEARPVAIVGVTPEQEGAWRTGLPGASLREYLSPEHMHRLWTEGALTIDAAEVPTGMLPFDARRVLLVVMRWGSNAVGVMSLDHGIVAHDYTAGDVALAQAVAKLAGLVIERERLLRERARAQASELVLRETNRRMNEFMSLAAHELKTPLTTINGMIQLAQRALQRLDRADGSQQTDVTATLTPLLMRAHAQTGRITRLVNDLLDTSRIHAGRLDYHPERCDLVALVHESIDEQCQLAPSRAINLTVVGGPELWIVADRDRVMQVMSNYLGNALKYSPGDRVVDVRVESAHGMARVCVRDEGPGIAATEQPLIWERFYRAEGIEHRHGSQVGLGLGLHICRTIITAHGGQVGVDSAPGQGSAFWFTLPL